jgi:valyl-tRNA synthetase
MNLPAADSAPPVPPAKEDGGIFDRWILDRMNRTVSDVVRQLDDYRFNDAASALYQFVWHEFCDWYLEWAKPVLYGKGKEKDKKAAQDTLRTVLVTSLKLLHPFMPYVTEEIYQKVVPGAGSIMVSPFPREDGGLPTRRPSPTWPSSRGSSRPSGTSGAR